MHLPAHLHVAPFEANRCDLHARETDARVLMKCEGCRNKMLVKANEHREAKQAQQLRISYQKEVGGVAQTILLTLMQKDMIATLRGGQEETKKSVQDLVDHALIISKCLVDELSRLVPPAHYAKSCETEYDSPILGLAPFQQYEPPPPPPIDLESPLEEKRTMPT